jgi:hypothetical protein
MVKYILILNVLILFSCSKLQSSGRSDYETILSSHCRDQLRKKDIPSKLQGRWKLVATGCNGDCLANSNHPQETKENVELVFQSGTSVIFYRDNIPQDTVTFEIKSETSRASTFQLSYNRLLVQYNSIIYGDMFFCSEVLCFYQIAGGIYFLKKQ